jgi:hypothetical protein
MPYSLGFLLRKVSTEMPRIKFTDAPSVIRSIKYKVSLDQHTRMNHAWSDPLKLISGQVGQNIEYIFALCLYLMCSQTWLSFGTDCRWDWNKTWQWCSKMMGTNSAILVGIYNTLVRLLTSRVLGVFSIIVLLEHDAIKLSWYTTLIKRHVKYGCWWNIHCTGCQKTVPVRPLGTRFTSAISCFESGPQEPHRDIFLNTVYKYSTFQAVLASFTRLWKSEYFTSSTYGDRWRSRYCTCVA